MQAVAAPQQCHRTHTPPCSHVCYRPCGHTGPLQRQGHHIPTGRGQWADGHTSCCLPLLLRATSLSSGTAFWATLCDKELGGLAEYLAFRSQKMRKVREQLQDGLWLRPAKRLPWWHCSSCREMGKAAKVLGQWAGYGRGRAGPYITPYTKINSKQIKCYL